MPQAGTCQSGLAAGVACTDHDNIISWGLKAQCFLGVFLMLGCKNWRHIHFPLSFPVVREFPTTSMKEAMPYDAQRSALAPEPKRCIEYYCANLCKLLTPPP